MVSYVTVHALIPCLTAGIPYRPATYIVVKGPWVRSIMAIFASIILADAFYNNHNITALSNLKYINPWYQRYNAVLH